MVGAPHAEQGQRRKVSRACSDAACENVKLFD